VAHRRRHDRGRLAPAGGSSFRVHGRLVVRRGTQGLPSQPTETRPTNEPGTDSATVPLPLRTAAATSRRRPFTLTRAHASLHTLIGTARHGAPGGAVWASPTALWRAGKSQRRRATAGLEGTANGATSRQRGLPRDGHGHGRPRGPMGTTTPMFHAVRSRACVAVDINGRMITSTAYIGSVYAHGAGSHVPGPRTRARSDQTTLKPAGLMRGWPVLLKSRCAKSKSKTQKAGTSPSAHPRIRSPLCQAGWPLHCPAAH